MPPPRWERWTCQANPELLARGRLSPGKNQKTCTASPTTGISRSTSAISDLIGAIELQPIEGARPSERSLPPEGIREPDPHHWRHHRLSPPLIIRPSFADRRVIERRRRGAAGYTPWSCSPTGLSNRVRRTSMARYEHRADGSARPGCCWRHLAGVRQEACRWKWRRSAPDVAGGNIRQTAQIEDAERRVSIRHGASRKRSNISTRWAPCSPGAIRQIRMPTNAAAGDGEAQSRHPAHWWRNRRRSAGGSRRSSAR